MDHGERSIAIGGKRQLGARVKARGIYATANRERRDELPCRRILEIAITPLRHPLNRRWWAMSIAKPVGDLQ